MKDPKKIQLAEKLAAEISPIIANAIQSGDLTFVGLTVVVDSKYSTTFPFHAIPEGDTEEDKKAGDEDSAKAILLAAVEYARTAGVLKAKSLQLLEDLLA